MALKRVVFDATHLFSLVYSPHLWRHGLRLFRQRTFPEFSSSLIRARYFLGLLEQLTCFRAFFPSWRSALGRRFPLIKTYLRYRLNDRSIPPFIPDRDVLGGLRCPHIATGKCEQNTRLFSVTIWADFANSLGWHNRRTKCDNLERAKSTPFSFRAGNSECFENSFVVYLSKGIKVTHKLGLIIRSVRLLDGY